MAITCVCVSVNRQEAGIRCDVASNCLLIGQMSRTPSHASTMQTPVQTGCANQSRVGHCCYRVGHFSKNSNCPLLSENIKCRPGAHGSSVTSGAPSGEESLPLPDAICTHSRVQPAAKHPRDNASNQPGCSVQPCVECIRESVNQGCHLF